MSELDLEKYELLYNYQKDQFAIVKSHYEKLEDKASKYITYLSIFVTAFSLLAKYYFIDEENRPTAILFYLTALYITITFSYLCSAIGKLFHCLKVKEVFQANTSDAMINYFKHNKRGSVYLGLATHYKDIIEIYTQRNKEKSDLLDLAFEDIRLVGAGLIVIIILIVLGKIIS